MTKMMEVFNEIHTRSAFHCLLQLILIKSLMEVWIRGKFKMC